MPLKGVGFHFSVLLVYCRWIKYSRRSALYSVPTTRNGETQPMIEQIIREALREESRKESVPTDVMRKILTRVWDGRPGTLHPFNQTCCVEEVGLAVLLKVALEELEKWGSFYLSSGAVSERDRKRMKELAGEVWSLELEEQREQDKRILERFVGKFCSKENEQISLF